MRGLAVALVLVAAASASAQEIDRQSSDHGHMGHGAGPATPGSEVPSTQAYKQADMAMHAAMDRVYTGDPDRDFLTGMVPHHQGAIEMAKVVLKFGKDPGVRKLAQKIIDDQEREIAEMRLMIEARDKAQLQK